MKSILVTFLVFSLSLLIYSCTSVEETENKDKKAESTEKKDTIIKKSVIKEAEISPLSYEMRAMEQQLKWIKTQLDSNESWNEEIFINFHTIDTLQATQGGIQNDKFKTFSSSFMDEYSSLIHEKQTKEQFSLVIKSCISCHEVYCTGPIPRIKKLDQ